MKIKRVLYPMLSVIMLTAFITSCNNYGEKLKFPNGKLYYQPPVSKDEALKLGEYLEESEFFDGTSKIVQLNKINDIWVLKIVISKGMEKEDEYVQIVDQFARELSFNVFDEQRIDIYLCDKNLETLKEVKQVSQIN